jgi:hypothetical protein
MKDSAQRLTQSAPTSVAARTPAPWAMPGQRHGGVPSWSRAIALCTLFAFSACSATLTRRDRVFHEGTIVGSDAESVWIGTESNGVERVRRTDIADIDHPGNVLGTIGLIGGAASGVLLGISLDSLAGSHHDSKAPFYAVEWGMCLVTGVVLAIIGWSDYFASRSAANNLTSTPAAPVRLSPAARPALPPPVAPGVPSPPNALDR